MRYLFGLPPRASVFVAALMLGTSLPTTIWATGIEEPARWVSEGETPQVLIRPEFFFEFEVKRLAAELHPEFKAIPPEFDANDEGGTSGDYSGQTSEGDSADFDEAVEKKVIAPPDAEGASKAHEEMRGLIFHTERDNADAPSPDPAVPQEFASEFADYHRGALAFRQGRMEKAAEAWNALLERPAAERHYRTTWATFMLGKIAIEAEAWDEAIGWMQKTRKVAKEGFGDSLGLAASSLGWEAFADLHSARLGEAARLYLEQLASGDMTAVISLRRVNEELFVDDADLPALAKDPVLQRLGTAGAVAEMSPFASAYGETKEDLTTRWLAAVEKIGAKNLRDADRLAWIAYMRGDFARAKRWLALADAKAPYVLWLNAKFALRDGKVDAAAKMLSEALAKFTPPGNLVTRPTDYVVTRSADIVESADELLRGDLANVKLSRGEFLAAIKLFRDAEHSSDAYYLADSVLTIEELKQFIKNESIEEEQKEKEKKANEAQKKKEDGEAPDPESTEAAEAAEAPERKPPPPGIFLVNDTELNSILGRRLVRAEKFAEARPYLRQSGQEALDKYVDALNRARNAKASKEDRAAAFEEAADIMYESGAELADYFDPVTLAARLTGKSVETGPTPVFSMKYSKPIKFVPPVAKAEQTRLKKHGLPEIRRYYSTYLAADLAWKAAALMPDNTKETAELLNSTGSWLKNGDEAAADRFYQAIERRCPNTEIGKIAIKKHWFVTEDELGESAPSEKQ